MATRLGIDMPLCREKLELTQLEALRHTVCHAKTNNPLYRERLAGLNSDALQIFSDLARLPLLTAYDLISQGHRLLSLTTMAGIEEEIRRMLLQVPAIYDSLATGQLIFGKIHRVAGFAASHTAKRTILDLRSTGEENAAHT